MLYVHPYFLAMKDVRKIGGTTPQHSTEATTWINTKSLSIGLLDTNINGTGAKIMVLYSRKYIWKWHLRNVGNLSRYPFLLYRASYLLSLCPQVIFVMPVSWFANPIKITSRSNTSNFKIATSGMSWQWRHNERDGVSNIQPHECLLNRLFKRRSKKTAKLCVIGLCAGNSQVTGDFPAPTASNA